MKCNNETTAQGFFIDQPKDLYCHRCHSKISFKASGLRFIQHQQPNELTAKSKSATIIPSSRKQMESALKDGQPLPDYGICSHYKKSHRWLR